MKYVWDPVKDKINQAKHGKSLALGQHVFDDPKHLLRHDDRFNYAEHRYQVIGRTKEGILFVVFAERDEDTIRLISVRDAEPSEKRFYWADWDRR
ncbi:MAG: BrnT family toxin [Pseudomonadota bacterium]